MTIKINEAILLKTLLDGKFTTEDGTTATLTVKGFVGANIIGSRLLLQRQPLSKDDIDQAIKFLNDAEAALNMLDDKEE